MAEYIKRKEALSAIKKASDTSWIDVPSMWRGIKKMIREISSTDVVTVVRCEDCWKRPFDNCPFHEHLGYTPEDDFFCGEGERKAND